MVVSAARRAETVYRPVLLTYGESRNRLAGDEPTPASFATPHVGPTAAPTQAAPGANLGSWASVASTNTPVAPRETSASGTSAGSWGIVAASLPKPGPGVQPTLGSWGAVAAALPGSSQAVAKTQSAWPPLTKASAVAKASPPVLKTPPVVKAPPPALNAPPAPPPIATTTSEAGAPISKKAKTQWIDDAEAVAQAAKLWKDRENFENKVWQLKQEELASSAAAFSAAAEPQTTSQSSGVNTQGETPAPPKSASITNKQPQGETLAQDELPTPPLLRGNTADFGLLRRNSLMIIACSSWYRCPGTETQTFARGAEECHRHSATEWPKPQARLMSPSKRWDGNAQQSLRV